MNCIDVVRSIIRDLSLASAQFTLVEHFVGVNWRVRCATTELKLHHLKEGLVQHEPYRMWKIMGWEILGCGFQPAEEVSHSDRVISLSSKIFFDGEERHLAMMNLHPEDDLSYGAMMALIEAVTEGMPGYILESGRHYHFYGVALLTEHEWIRFLAQFLMPTILVSPRYIGHCLYRGYAALRLTTERKFKPVLPKVCGLLEEHV